MAQSATQSRFEAVIGLEVHAQLRTASKIFCSCSTAFGRAPNENVCEVCSGMPGVLPVLNEKVVEYAAKMGLATGCVVNPRSVFARKNYFYPDLPKGYQISQYEEPLCEHGHVDIEVGGQSGDQKRRIGITRIHVEEDAGKSIHAPGENRSFVDLNRTGVPLIEIVSEPDMRTPDEAEAYLRALWAILVYLDICDGNMEEGSFRCDANVSIRPVGQEAFGTRAELKNMNSFRHVNKAIAYEIARQTDLVEDGEQVVQETRLYDADKGTTHSMRGKEEAHDYRYYPDPDLVPVVLDPAWLARWESELPELPTPRLARLREQYSLSADDARLLTQERAVADYFEAAVAHAKNPAKFANFFIGTHLPLLAEKGAEACALAPERSAEAANLVADGVVSWKIAKDVYPGVFESGGSPAAVVRDKGLAQESDEGALEAVVDEVIAENPDEAERVRGGDRKVVGFLMGQIMKKTRGKANPGVASKLLTDKLS